MSVNAYNTRPSYKHKLDFWRALEKRYNEQRQKWVEASSQMMASKLAAENARKGLQALKQTKDEKAENEEFSDVDSYGFAEPVEQYHS